MRYVKQLSVVLVLIITTALVGCNANTPSDVVSEYFDKVKKGDTSAKELFAVVEESGQEVLDEDGVSKEVTDKLIKKMKKLTYKINSEEINGDTAKVNVTVNSMNFGEVFGKVFSESMNYFMGQAFSGVEMSDEDSENYMNDLLSTYLDEVSYSDKTDDITLSKIDGKWKIDESESLVKLVMGFDSSIFDEVLNSEENQEEKEQPPVTVEELPMNVTIIGRDSIGSMYMEATFTNNSKYAIKGFDVTVLLKDKNEKTYLTNYDTVMPGETSPKFETFAPETGNSEDMEYLKYDITVVDENGEEIYLTYDAKLKTYKWF